MTITAASPDYEPSLWTSGFVPSQGVELLSSGNRHAIFHDGLQRLVELNATAYLIWSGLKAGLPPEELTQVLAGHGAGGQQADLLRHGLDLLIEFLAFLLPRASHRFVQWL